MINKKRLINLFMELVRIDSVSKEEREVADRIIREFTNLGFLIKEDSSSSKTGSTAGNLIIDIPGNNSYPRILLSAHMDRVEPGRGIEPVIDGEYIKSKGDTVLAGDDLIGVVAIIEALRILKENEIDHPPLKIIFTVAEEIGLLGAKHLDPAEVLECDLGFVFDVDGEIGTVVNRAPTQLKFNAKIKGKAAHAGINPKAGINAIKIVSLALSEMNLGQIDKETTANIGVIKGGKASNIVPEDVELEGEIRSHSDEKLAKQEKDMKNLLELSAKKYKGQVSFDIEKLYSSFAISKESGIIRLVEKSAGDLNLPFSLKDSGGGSDANIFNEIGLETLNLAVAMENVHSSEEQVKISNFYSLVNLILKIIENTKDNI
ncbi:M20/M25/M40 family metallo-hydrolase [Natronospora cellulosivora (SeqCode)]